MRTDTIEMCSICKKNFPSHIAVKEHKREVHAY